MDKYERARKVITLEEATREAEQMERARREAEQADREVRIAQAHEIAGRVQAFTFVGKVLTVGSLVQLKNIKETKVYRELPNIGTWESYCKYLGLSRQKIDEDLTNLAKFGEEFLLTVGTFSLGYRDMKKLRQLTHDGTVQMVEDAITIGGETIPIDKDHTEELQTAVEKLLETFKSQEARIEKLEKHKDQLVAEETKNLTTEKKALLKEVERMKAFDPEEKDQQWAVKAMAVIEQQTGEMATSVHKFVTDERFADDRHLQALVMGHLTEARLILSDLEKRLLNIIGSYDD